MWQQIVCEAVVEYARLARSRRLTVSFAADLELIEGRLRGDPAVWGDPLFDLHVLNVTCHRGHSSFLYVYFYLDVAHHTVIVQAVDPHPYGPLA